MKKVFLFVLCAMALLTACSDSEQIESAVPNQAAQDASNIRSYDEALQIAKSSISILESNPKTRSASSREIDLSKNEVVKLDPKTRRATDTNDTLMYVFNFADEQGFAVVSASKNTEGLLAVTEKGTYNPDSLSEIESFNIFMDLAKSYVENAEATGGPKRIIVRPLEKDSIGYREGNVVGPYVSVNWGQHLPEGELFVNNISGCTNTAIAQIMSYYEYPSQIVLTYLTNDPMIQTFNWSQMKAHSTGHSLSSCSTSGDHSSISKLMKELGYLNHSITYNTYTYTYNSYVPSTMSTLGYQTGSWSNYNTSNVKAQLDSNHLILITGKDSSQDIGHAWVIDGYKTEEEVVYHYLQYPDDMIWVLSGIEVIGYNYYCHCNFGYYGTYNGYYLSGVFNTNYSNYTENLSFLPIYHN